MEEKTIAITLLSLVMLNIISFRSTLVRGQQHTKKMFVEL